MFDLRLLTRDKSFYSTYGMMTLVIALQNLVSFSVNLADNIMIGGYSQDALSGIAMVTQIHYFLQMTILGIGNGIVVLAAQYWGKGKIEPIRKVTSIGLMLSVLVGAVMTVLSYFFPSQLLRILTDEPVVIEQGSQYMVIVCFSFILFSVTNTLLSAHRSVETVKIGFVVTLTALVVNIFLNYCLIYGKLGMPELGARGAAYATLTSRVVEFGIVAVYTLRIDKKIRWRFSEILPVDKVLFKDYFRVGTPVIFSNMLWGIATSVQIAILGRLGNDTIAANSIATTIFQVISVITYASASASAVVIGKTVGTGNLPKVKEYTKSLQLIYLMIGVATGTLLFASKDVIVGLYSSITPQTYDLTKQFITVLSVTVVGTSYQVACLTGIVTGGGDTRFVLINDIIHQWLIVIPLSILSAFVFHLPYWVTFSFLKIDQILKCIPAVVKTNRYRWVHCLTRESAEEK